MKFRSDVAGTITGIRFYKGAANTGSYIGLLYSSSGTLLAQATYRKPDGIGMAAGKLHHAGDDPGQHDIHRRVFQHVGLCVGRGVFHVGRQWIMATPRAQIRGGRPERSVLLRQHAAVPHVAATPTPTGGWTWCSRRTPLPGPDLTIASSHTGSFTQGQTGATYTITASNRGTARPAGQ